ncbi:ABC transporter permease [Microbacterium nymphoidis]|uniref:ABC transporter permease n=1 Tax=Microbacterium nymphoidis TaxID=2898586 RepID=UPI001E5F37A0|nr:ABC transporter permease [Microbacterium nymphoidis]MCD2498642.1 ABC transporter permease [Microbacterium nymphoidis]
MTAAVLAPAKSAAPSLGWLRERGMGSSLLIAALSSAFGVILVTVTGYIGAVMMDNPVLGESATAMFVVVMLSVLLVGVAVYVASIVTANTFATIVAGRTRQIALMRLIGASARSERAAIARQGLGVGVIGAAIGLVLATSAAAIALPLVNRALGVGELPFSVLQPWIVIPAAAVALTTWAAAWVGSRRVLTVTPLQALAGSQERTADDVRRPARTASAVSLLVLGIGLLVGGLLFGTFINPMGVAIAFLGGVLSFTGLALGSTFIMPPVLALVGRMFGSSPTARLAAENAMRHPERSARMTIGVVMGVTLVTMFSVASESAKAMMMRGADSEIGAQISQVMDSFAAVMMGLVGVSAIIAAVGLVNLLTIGVVQRRRELGLLRALGFTAKQVRRMVLLEAAHISIASLATGLVLGVAYGWIGAQSTLGSLPVPPEMTTPNFILPTIPWTLMLGVVAATALLTVVASLAPTRLATRVVPVEALATD